MSTDRASLMFDRAVRRSFGYLSEADFKEIDVSPTRVRFRRRDIDVDIYHGRQSYEIDADISWSERRYSLAELLTYVDPARGRAYRARTALTTEQVALRVGELAAIFTAVLPVLDRPFPLALEVERTRANNEMALKMLAGRVRPQAEEAFRSKNYAHAAELYRSIEPDLSVVERLKLAFAQSRVKG